MERRSEQGNIASRLAAGVLVLSIAAGGIYAVESAQTERVSESAADTNSPETSSNIASSDQVTSPMEQQAEPTPAPTASPVTQPEASPFSENTPSAKKSAFAGRAACTEIAVFFSGTKKKIQHDTRVWLQKHPGCESQIMNNLSDPKTLPYKPGKNRGNVELLTVEPQ